MGPRLFLNWIELKAKLKGPVGRFFQLKAADRTSVRNKSAVRALSQVDTFDIGRQENCRNRKIIRYKVNFSEFSLVIDFNNISVMKSYNI